MAGSSNVSLKQQRDELLLNLSELSKACPLHRLNPEDCPLFPLRQMKPPQRNRWLKSLNEEDLSYLASYHHVCMSIRLESRLAASD